MFRREIDVLCITETHIQECQPYFSNDGYLFILSGNTCDAPLHIGVGFIISPALAHCIISSTLFSNRIACIKLKAKFGIFALCSCYVPHNGHDLEMRRNFFNSLQDCIRKISVNGPKLIYGDFNARLHFRNANEHDVFGPYCCGDTSAIIGVSHNRSLLIEACIALKLCVLRIQLRTSKRSAYHFLDTWCNPDGGYFSSRIRST